MNTKSTHIMAEFHGCDPEALNNVEDVERLMRSAARAAHATVVESSFHKYGDQGVSGVLVLAESHLSIHTWPEANYAATDIYTCGDQCRPEEAHKLLVREFAAARHEVMVVERGLVGASGMRLVRHTQSGDVSEQVSDGLAHADERSDRT